MLQTVEGRRTGPLDSPVSEVGARPIRIPFDKPIVTPNYVIDAIDGVAVRVVDTDGASGESYLWCVSPSQVPVLVESLRHLAPCVRGRSPATVGAAHAAMRNDVNFLGLKGSGVFGLSGLDMALHDLKCRRLDVSLGKLLGQVRDRVPAYWSGLMLTEGDDDLVREAEALVERGFRACKIRVGRNTIEEDARRIALVRSATPDSLVLMLDAVQYYTPQEAVRACRRFEEFNPLWLEEPVVHNDYRGLAYVVANSPIPIASGENEYLPEGFAQLVETGLDYVLADLERVGGITGWGTVSETLRVRTTVMTPHVYPHLSIQLMSAAPGKEVWVEYMSWWDRLMTYSLDVKDGHMTVPDVVGSGVDLDPEAVDRFAEAPWQIL